MIGLIVTINVEGSNITRELWHMMGQVPDTRKRNISKREELLKTNSTSLFCQGLEWTGSYEFFKPFPEKH